MGNPFDQFDRPASGNPFDQFDDSAPKAEQNSGIIGDTATDIKRGFEQLPGAVTGLADIVNPLTYINDRRYFDEGANWLGKKTGFQPSKWQEAASKEYSPERQASDEEVSKAWNNGGIGDIAGAYLSNPRSIAGVVGQSLPSTIGGGVIARGAMKGIAALSSADMMALRTAAAAGDEAALTAINRMATTAGGIGEGAITAGQNMDQVSRDADPSRAALTSATAGALTGAIGKYSGRLANKLGLPDLETVMAGGGTGVGGMPWYKRIPSSIVQESLLQEFPQSAQEQIMQNIAEKKPWDEGVARASIEGALAGAAMGGGVAMLPQQKPNENATNTPPTNPPNTPPTNPLLAQVTQTFSPQPGSTSQLDQTPTSFDVPNTPPPGPLSGAVGIGRMSGAIPPEPVLRERDFVPPPSGSYGQLAEFENLLNSERADKQSRVSDLLSGQAVQAASEAESQQARVEAAQAQQSAQERYNLLQQVAETLPGDRNLKRAFGRALKEAGYSNLDFTPEETASIDNFNQINRSAGIAANIGPDIIPSAPNELDAAQMGVKQKVERADNNRHSSNTINRIHELELIEAQDGLSPQQVSEMRGLISQLEAREAAKKKGISELTQTFIDQPNITTQLNQTSTNLPIQGINNVPQAAKTVKAETQGKTEQQPAAAIERPKLPPVTGSNSAVATKQDVPGRYAVDPKLLASYEAAKASGNKAEQRRLAKEINVQRTKKIAAAREHAPVALSLGSAPNSAEPITVKDGVVHVGNYPAQNFDTGENVTVENNATPQQIKDALSVAGAIGRGQKVFGLPKEAAPNSQAILDSSTPQDAAEVKPNSSAMLTSSPEAATKQPAPQADTPALTPFQQRVAEKKAEKELAKSTRKEKLDALIAKRRATKEPSAKPSTYGETNTIFTADRAAKARELLRKKLGQVSAGIDPEIVQAGIELSGFHIESGARKFADYSARMISDIGDVVKPYLKSWYLAVRNYPGFNNAGMQSEAELDIAEKPDKKETEQAAPRLDTSTGKHEIATQIADFFIGGGEFKSIVEARKKITEISGQDINPATEQAKQSDETVEVAVVLAGREIVKAGRKQNRSVESIYDRLVDLYRRQPNLAVRSSTSVRDQAYSTPAPLSYLASELAGINYDSTVLEPTAGNGMLLIGASFDNSFANELNPERAAMLRAMGFDALQKNAANNSIVPSGTEVDAVIANPPFGVTKDENGETIYYDVTPEFRTSEVDHAIAFKALEQMKADGRAVLIVGGIMSETEDKRREDYRGKNKRQFYYNLYKNYKVVDHFTVDGGLYSKQGASYPVDVIVIQGKGESTRALPAANIPKIYKTYEALKEKFSENYRVESSGGIPGRTGRSDDSSRSGNTSIVDGVAGGQGNGNGNQSPTTSNSASVPNSRPPNNGKTKGSGAVSSTGESNPERVPVRGNKNAVPGTGVAARLGTKGTTGRNEPVELGGISVVDGQRVESGLTDRTGAEQETENQVAYTPKSSGTSVGTLVPRAMRDSIDSSLQRIADQVGDIDQYVADSLAMDTDAVRSSFSAEQIDALALSIRNAEAGKGFIIGDQTGIGKGRVVAAMIRYSLVNGKVPIFVTEKPNLYSDMIRDLDDIGMTDDLALDTKQPKILITNGSGVIPYTLLRNINGEIVENQLSLKSPKSGKALDEVMRGMINNDSLGDYKVIFTTYSQLQTVKGAKTTRQNFVEHFGASNYMIFDESHNAGGTGETQARTKEQREAQKEGESLTTGRASFVRNLVQRAFGTFFSSATYAKRPDVMDLYSSTNMKLAVDKIADLGEAIKLGGVPMQQAVANMLTKDGQYIRRERTFAGISYDTVDAPVDKQSAENMASAMRSILAFSRAKEAVIDKIQEQLDAQGATISASGGEAYSVQGANFGSIMHNLIDQMLLSLKAKSAIDHAILRLKSGEKVVMTVSNTMGSFLQSYAEDLGLNTGDPVSLSFSDLYERYLEKQRIVTTRSGNGEKTKYRLTDAELGPSLVASFNAIREQIQSSGFGNSPISPIDYIHGELRKAGYTTDEITGRTIALDYGKNGSPVLTSRSSNIKQRVGAVAAFNSGSVDVLILNQAGATGLSLHASSKVNDKRKRHMIVVQAEKNIDTHMQMLGRVHRTGQVIAPAYSQMMADIPAEMRPAAVLLKKMASLNANTTASRKSSVTAEGVVDFMNDYGGQVVHEYLRDNPDVLEAVGGSSVLKLTDNSEDGDESDIRKFTGYIPILPIQQQERIYQELTDRYNELLNSENNLGTNKLEAKAIDLDAETLSSKSITEKKDDPSVFAAPAFMEQVDVKRSIKPYSSDEVAGMVSDTLGDKTPNEFAIALLAELKQKASEYAEARMGKMTAEGVSHLRIAMTKNQLQTSYDHAKIVLQTIKVGDTVSIKDQNGQFIYGAITNIAPSWKAENPAAGSAWKATFALANGEAKSITINFSQIGRKYEISQTTMAEVYNIETKSAERVSVMSMFDSGANIKREKRWIITGNLLAGFAKHQGQIVSYTKKDGTNGQGILMSRQFDFEKEMKGAPVTIKTGADALTVLRSVRNGKIGTKDALFTIENRGSQYEVTTPSSRKDGGTYYLDKGITDIVGDFYKRGSIMSAKVYEDSEISRLVDYMTNDRQEPIVAKGPMAEAARSALGIDQKINADEALGNQDDGGRITPSDKAIYGMASEGKNAKDILKFIAASSRNPFYRQLARVLLKTGIAPKITVGDGKGFTFNAGNDKKYAASYDPKTDTVSLFRPASSERHALHELVHAATIKALAKNGMASAQMRALFNHAKSTGKLEGMYGKENIDEFVAEAFSNPKFQEVLKQIDAPEGRKTLWDRFVSVIRGILGLKPISHDALSRALSIGREVMRENMALSGNINDGTIRPQLAWHGTPHIWPPEPGFPHGRPRLDKMGTGEGAQAYGFGWYSAEALGVADGYRKNLSAAKSDVSDWQLQQMKREADDMAGMISEMEKYVIPTGQWLLRNVPDKTVVTAASSTEKPGYVFSPYGKAKIAKDKEKRASMINAKRERLTSLQNEIKEAEKNREGSLYKLDIPDDVMPNFLDWDKPLSEQTKEVKKALFASGKFKALKASAKDRVATGRDVNNWTGSFIYSEISRDGNSERNNKQASEYLSSIGIVGNRYLDGQSRKTGLQWQEGLPEGWYYYKDNDGSVGIKNNRNLKMTTDHSSEENAHRRLFGDKPSWNYVIWDQKTLDRIALLERNGAKLDAIRYNQSDNTEPTITIDGIERPRLNSNGKPIAQTDEGIRNFWKWFGNSKAIDAQGRPLVVYHGSPDVRGIFSEGFKAKSRGSVFFAAKGYDVANSYADASRSFDYQNAEPQTIPLYLSINNPMIVDAKGAFWRETERHVEEAKTAGHDGIIIKNSVDFYNNQKGRGKATTVYAWFSPAQAKSAVDGNLKSRVDLTHMGQGRTRPILGATGNNGQFSPDNNDIRYNVASDWIDNNAPESVKSFVENAFTSSKSTSLVTAFNTQFHKAQKWAAEGKVRFKQVYDLGQKFIGDTSKFGVMAQNAAPTLFHEIKSLSDVATALKGMKSLGDITGKNHTRDIEAIANPLYEGTLYGGGNPMAGVKFSDAKLKSDYGLTDRQIKLYHEALAAVNVSMDEMAKSIISKHAKNEKVGFNSDLDISDMADGVVESLKSKQEDMRLSFDVEKQRADGEIDDLKNQGKEEESKNVEQDLEKKKESFDKNIERLDKTISDVQGIVDKNQKIQDHGYFPLMRFGENTVTAIDDEGNTQFFGMYEGNPLIPKSGQYQANKIAREIRAEHPEWTVTTGIQNTEKYKLYSGMNMEAVQLFAEHMDAESLEPFQEFLRVGTNNRSVMKRLIHRKGTPGFDRDVRRTLSQFIVSNARSTSSNYHMFDMRKAAEEADLDGGDIGKEAVKLYKYVAEPREEAHQLRGFLFFNFLGGSLASAAVNMSQVPMMTFPFLSKYMPANGLASLLASSARMAMGDPSKMTGSLGRALMQAELDGVTAPQEIHQMMATASNSLFSGSRGVNLVLRAWGTPFALTESFNRRTTFIAAFKIAEKMSRAELLKTGSTSAFDFAENAVKETQGVYNKGNRPNIGRGAVGATLMTFKQFSIMYLELLKRLPQKQRMMMLGILLMAAGGGGLPFAEDIEDIIDTIGQWLGYSTNTKKSIRHAATGILGKTGADITINGLASQMGIDLHSRFGMQNLIPGTGVLKQSSINKGRDIEEFFGPAGSVVQSLGSALGNLATGKVEQAALSVAPNALANMYKGSKMLSTGYGVDSKGRRTLPATTMEGVSKFIGFNPKSFANDSTIRNDLYQDQQLMQVKREEFTSAFVSAMLDQDMEARKKAMDDLREWNNNNPQLRVAVSPATILSRVRAARMESPDRFIKAMPKAMRANAMVELRQ